MPRKIAAALIGLLAWTLLLVGGAYAFVGAYAASMPGGFVVDAGNPGPGLMMVVFGAVTAGIGWGLRAVARKIRPEAERMKGLVRG